MNPRYFLVHKSDSKRSVKKNGYMCDCNQTSCLICNVTLINTAHVTHTETLSHHDKATSKVDNKVEKNTPAQAKLNQKKSYT